MKLTTPTILTSFTLFTATIAILFSGCAGTPTKFEQKIFDIQTNYVPVLVLKTNTVWQTNTEVKTITVTNTQGVIVPMTVTNTVTIPQYSLVTVTQQIPQYEYKPSAMAMSAQATAGTIGNLAAPGVGGSIATGMFGLILAGWSWLRSSRATKTAINSSQVIETMRELLKTMPNGKQYDAVLTQWMQQHQADAGVLSNVLDILENNVSNNDAKNVVQQLQSALTELQLPPKV